ncbi:MAG: class I SAM-dependent methyltransferase [Pseudomonadota bacterium]
MTADILSWPDDGLETLGACPICGAAERETLHDQLRDWLFPSPHFAWTLHRCCACRLAYLDPRPTEDSIHLAYAAYHTHTAEDGDDPLHRGSGLQRLKNILTRQYLASRHDRRRMLRAPVAWPIRLHPRWRYEMDATIRFLPQPLPGSTLLDIGCGNGRFMAWARAAGWRCVGTEVDEAAAERARLRGFQVHCEQDRALDEGPFDAVTISHVIEHVHDPRLMLRFARRALKPGGFFFIDTPNVDARGHARFGPYWRGLEPPRHLQLFHPALLTKLLREEGFEQVHPAPGSMRILVRESLAIASAAGADASEWRLLGHGGALHGVVGNSAQEEFITLLASRS